MPIAQLALATALGIYILDAQSRNYSSATLAHYSMRLGRFVNWVQVQGVATITAVDAQHVRLYLVSRQGQVAPTTLHTEARALRAWFNFCVREGWLAVSPMATVQMPRRPKLIKAAVPLNTIRQALKRASPRDAAIVLLLLDTGLRASELCTLDINDIDLTTGTVRVRVGKGAKDRIVYLSARSLKALIRYRGGNAVVAVFTTAHGGKRLTRNALGYILRQLDSALTPHALRRTFAISSLRAGMDLFTLARLMGHESIDTLKQYLDLVEGDLENAHRRFSVLDQL